MNFTVQDVLRIVAYNPETGIFYRMRSRGRFKSGEVAGYVKSEGYRLISINGNWVYAHRLAWFVVTGRWPKEEIDHINCLRDDNRIENLREATRSQNMCNTRRQRGWHWHNKAQKWQSMLRINGARIYLGRYDTEAEAKLAYDTAVAFYRPFIERPAPPKQEAMI